MRTPSLISSLSRAFRKLIGPRADTFVCGDCLRNAQCGSEPDALCVTRAAQIASGRRRANKSATLTGF